MLSCAATVATVTPKLTPIDLVALTVVEIEHDIPGLPATQ